MPLEPLDKLEPQDQWALQDPPDPLDQQAYQEHKENPVLQAFPAQSDHQAQMV